MLNLFRGIFTSFRQDLATLSNWDKVFVWFWVAGPFFYLIERSPADIWLSLIGIGFIAHCIRTGNWDFLAIGWVRLIGLFWLVMLVTSMLSSNPAYAVGEAIVWIRFPLYAIACLLWVAGSRARLNMMMLMMGTASVIMCGVLAVEFIDVLRYGNEYGSRLSGPYGDLVPGSFLGKAMLPLAVTLCALAISLPLRQAILPLCGAGALVLFTIVTGERINALLISVAVFLAAFAWQIRGKRIAIFALIAVATLFTGIANIPALSDRFDPRNHQETSSYFESPYWFSVRPGVVTILEHPATGIGVGMHRLECANIPQGPDWLPGVNECHPHPHQFYVQIAGETGLFGLLFGFAAIIAMITYVWKGRHYQSLYARLAWIPIGMVFMPQPSADFFGQWNNLFLWFAVGLAMAMSRDRTHDIVADKTK